MAADAVSEKIRVAVIGTGNMGRHHVRNYDLLPSAQLVGISDVNPAAKQLADEHKVPFYTDYQRMIDETQPEAVSIVVPTPLHLPIGIYCLSKGIHCLIEKPIAYSIKDADKLIAAAEAGKLVLSIGHIERFNPLIRKIQQVVSSGKIGEIISITTKRVGGLPSVEPKTDVIIDLAVHDIDIISMLMGTEPESICSHTSRTHHSKNIDAAEILLDYGKASGFIQANWVTPVKIRSIAITGSLGYIEGNYITQELTHFKHNMERIKNGFDSFVIKMGKPTEEVIKVDFKEPLAVELQNFLRAVRGDKTAEIVDPRAARQALKLSLKAVEA